jgi:hypothetical protein
MVVVAPDNWISKLGYQPLIDRYTKAAFPLNATANSHMYISASIAEEPNTNLAY